MNEQRPAAAVTPITAAVYGNKGKPKPDKPARREVTTLVGQAIGAQLVAELYAAFGFKAPKDRPRKNPTPAVNTPPPAKEEVE